MWHNYFTVALRNLYRNRVFSAINILGLSVGMVASLLIFQYVAFEQSYDAFHPGAEDIYRIQLDSYQQGKLAFRSATSFPATAPTLKRDFPEVLEATRLLDSDGGVITYNQVQYRENHYYFADNSAPAVLHIPFLKGDPNTALQDPNAVVLSESTARKYFGDEEPMGKMLRLGNDPYLVKGVFMDYPKNSHLVLDLLFSFPEKHKEAASNWGWYDFYTYVKLRPGTDPDRFEAKIKNLVMQYSPERAQRGRRDELLLQPLRSIYLYSDLNQEAEANGNGQAVRFLLVIAFFILAIAWINYINLATARAADRAKEVGIRKAIGARRGQLVRQFLAESALLNGAAAAVALLLVRFALPSYNTLTGKALSWSQWGQPSLWGTALLTLVVGSLLAGMYPAFVLSGFRPIAVLKGRLQGAPGGLALRQTLIVFQFAASVLLIVGTLTVYKQLRYMQAQDLGFDPEQTLVLRGPGVHDSTYSLRASSFRQELVNAGIAPRVTASTYVPGIEIIWTTNYRRKGQPSQESNTVYVTAIDDAFLEAYGIGLAAGRNFSPSFGTHRKGVLLNETAAKLFGFRNPQEAINQEIAGYDTSVVVGVVKDYHQQGLQRAHWPMLFRYSPQPSADATQFYSLKVPARDLDKTLAAVKSRYDAFFPGNPFEYFFLDTFFNEQYKAERQFGRVFGLFAGLAILIAALGLFGLISFTAARRAREIGIRKVLGASVSGIVLLLARDFVKLAGLGVAIAVPLAWYVMEGWLADFAYRTEVGAGVLALAGLLALLVALLTVSFQAFKAAGANPVKALRTE